MSGFKPGDVLRYAPERSHCREGRAYVRDDGRAVDTFWRPRGDGDSHVLTDAELKTAERIFNVADYDALDYYSHMSQETWLTFHPDDRASIPSQGGLQQRLFVRKGATPHLGTQIENARAQVEHAEAALNTAKRTLDEAREQLAELEARKAVGA